jgi:hypothetical protein
MDNLVNCLHKLKEIGCTGIKISFEDEGALLNEMISMRYLTSSVGVELSVKIGGSESKRDIVDCTDINCNSIVAPMVESSFSLKKFLNSLKQYNYCGKKGFNLETIISYNNLDELSNDFKHIDFVTVGRVDFVGSLGKDRSYVNSEEIYNIVTNVFKKARENNIKCFLGGAITIESKDFIKNLIDNHLLDKFETRYVIFDTTKININDLEKLIYYANVFEVEWLKYVSSKYMLYANKDSSRIKMIEERISKNTCEI